MRALLAASLLLAGSGLVVAQSSTRTVKLEGPSDAIRLTLEVGPSAAKVLGPKRKEVCRVAFSSKTKLKLKNPQGKVVGVVRADADGGKLKLKNGDQTKTLFVLRRQTKDAYKLESGDTDKRLAKLKRRSYGWKIFDGKEQTLGKVKRKTGRTVLYDAQGKILYQTKGKVRPLALACLALPGLSRAQQVGLLLQLDRSAKPNKAKQSKAKQKTAKEKAK